MHCLRVLQLKNPSTKIYFSRLQLRIKKGFTFICFLLILTEACRAPLITEHLSLNVSWFSCARTQWKYNFWKNWFGKKKQKNFIVNNNKIIRAWYLSSKWLVCRSIVNQTTGGTSILSHIVSCFAIKWLKYTCNKGILSIQITSKWIFVLFLNFFPFKWKWELVIYYFLLLFCLTKQLRYATYGLETCCSYLGSIKHTNISMVKQTISTL